MRWDKELMSMKPRKRSYFYVSQCCQQGIVTAAWVISRCPHAFI